MRGMSLKYAKALASDSPLIGRMIGLSLGVWKDYDRKSYWAGFLSGSMGVFFVEMPCGEIHALQNEKNCLEDIMCRCGDPKHIVLKWTEK